MHKKYCTKKRENHERCKLKPRSERSKKILKEFFAKIKQLQRDLSSFPNSKDAYPLVITFSQYTSLDLLPPSPQGLEHGLQGPSTQCAAQGNVLQDWLVTGFRLSSQRLSLTTSRSSRERHVTPRVW